MVGTTVRRGERERILVMAARLLCGGGRVGIAILAVAAVAASISISPPSACTSRSPGLLTLSLPRPTCFCHAAFLPSAPPLSSPRPSSRYPSQLEAAKGNSYFSGKDDNDDDDDDEISSSSAINGDYGPVINGDFASVGGVNGMKGIEGRSRVGRGRKSGYDTDAGYSRFVYSTRRKRRVEQMRRRVRQRAEAGERDDEIQEDGYDNMMGKKRRSPLKRTLISPFRVAKALINNQLPEPGTLILVRHGESVWNANKTFTGWADPDLSERGYREVEHAARLLLAGGYDIDVVFTSRLKRAIRSTWILLQEINQVYLPVFKSWRLNERMYGALTGLCKRETAEKLGVELVQSWRGSLKSQPPSVVTSDAYWPGRDRRYSDLSFAQIPMTESLLDCMDRTKPMWEDKISYELRMGRNVLVVAHANTLRGLVKLIDDIGDEEIQEVAIPTGIPVVYKFDKDLKPIRPSGDKQTANFQMHMSGMFLEKPGLLKEALKLEEEWTNNVPGYEKTMNSTKTPLSPLERSLTKLEAVRELGEWAGQFVDPDAEEEDDGSDGNMGKPIEYIQEDDLWERGLHELEEGAQFDPEITYHTDLASSKLAQNENVEAKVTPTMISNGPCVTGVPSAALVPGMGSVPIRKDAVVVLIRHGKTEHNKLGLFTGWEDAPLAPDGRDEAREAGRLLKMHGFEFDVVYTSWLSRAIETAWLVLDELDDLWLPIIKSWRLNERMYGALTGKSKQMVAQKYGDAQFKAWRRGYTVRPPKVSSFSLDYPGNDVRYKYLNDIRVSLSESIMRSFDNGKLIIHRKLPKTESLKDCMDRTIPYFTNQIVPEAINKGQRVLISSSENAIRGLLMHLCDIPEEKIIGLEIPNGLPLIFDIKSKCVKLLDDGTGVDPLEKYSFGNAASYLFRPCQNEDGSPDTECDIRFMTPEMMKFLSENAEDDNVVDYVPRPIERTPVEAYESWLGETYPSERTGIRAGPSLSTHRE